MNNHKKRLKLVFDSCSLITTAKFKVDDRLILDYFLDIADIHIPQEVYFEATKEYSKYEDAREIKLRSDNQKIKVHEVGWDKNVFKDLEEYKIGFGEKELISLFLNKSFDYAIIDDFLACIICQRFKVKYLLLLDLIVLCAERKLLNEDVAIKMAEGIKSRYDIVFINHTISMIKRKGY